MSLTWHLAIQAAEMCARFTGRRYRVFRRVYTNGRTCWDYEPVGGWTP